MRHKRRPRSKNGKGRAMSTSCENLSKPWNSEGYCAATEYAAMRSLFFDCWACGASRKPQAYFGPWLIERAHIANKPRREDRRLVVMLCTICHKASHGERIAGFLRPAITPGQMIALKSVFDAEWVDLEFVQRHSIRRISHEALDPFYTGERIRNRVT